MHVHLTDAALDRTHLQHTCFQCDTPTLLPWPWDTDVPPSEATEHAQSRITCGVHVQAEYQSGEGTFVEGEAVLASKCGPLTLTAAPEQVRERPTVLYERATFIHTACMFLREARLRAMAYDSKCEALTRPPCWRPHRLCVGCWQQRAPHERTAAHVPGPPTVSHAHS